MEVFSRRISMLIDIDLIKNTKEAHASSIEKIAEAITQYASDLMSENGYVVRRTASATTLHTVRHVIKKVIVNAGRMKSVG